MSRQIIRLLGAKSIRRARFDFYCCPKCHRAQESLLYGADELSECYGCDRKIPVNDWGSAKVTRRVAICANCDKLVPLTSDNLGWTGYLCGQCENLVAVPYGSSVVAPQEILRPTWNPEMVKRARSDGQIRWAICRTKREHLPARMLYLLASAEENSNFIYGSENERKTMLCFDGTEYWGYLFWSQTRNPADGQRRPVLRQLFLREGFRGKGLGTALVRTWIEQIALPLATSFGVESPNERTRSVLVRLGHAYFEGDKIIGTTCYFVPSM